MGRNKASLARRFFGAGVNAMLLAHPSTGVWDFSTDTMLDYDPLVMYAEWAEIVPVP